MAALFHNGHLNHAIGEDGLVDERVLDLAEHEDWGPVGNDNQPDHSQRARAVAPSRLSGADKFQGLFKRDSKPYIWAINFRNGARDRTGDERLPAGFPSMAAFWENSLSLASFQFGFKKYKELYPGPLWRHWSISGANRYSDAQTLRMVIWKDFKAKADGGKMAAKMKPSVRRSIVWWTVEQGLWSDTPLEPMPPKLRVWINLSKMRWVVKVRRFGLAWLENHAETVELRRIHMVENGEFDDPELCLDATRVERVLDEETGRESPSLKRARLA